MDAAQMGAAQMGEASASTVSRGHPSLFSLLLNLNFIYNGCEHIKAFVGI
jgi:hypothetical protein